jgi:hypothetical protein
MTPTGGARRNRQPHGYFPSPRTAACTRTRRTQIILFGDLATGRQPSGETAHIGYARRVTVHRSRSAISSNTANLDVDTFYLAWLDWRRIGDGEQPRNVSLDRGRVALEPGPPFGSPESGFVWLNAGPASRGVGLAKSAEQPGDEVD